MFCLLNRCGRSLRTLHTVWLPEAVYIFIQHSEAYYRIRNEKIGGSNLDTPIGLSTDFKSEYERLPVLSFGDRYCRRHNRQKIVYPGLWSAPGDTTFLSAKKETGSLPSGERSKTDNTNMSSQKAGTSQRCSRLLAHLCDSQQFEQTQDSVSIWLNFRFGTGRILKTLQLFWKNR